MMKNNLDEKLFDAVLKVAAEEALRREMEEMPTCEDFNSKYKPSADLDKKIRMKISQHRFKEAAFIWTKSTMKFVACLAVVIVISSTILLSVEATRNYIFNAVIKWQDDHLSLEYNDSANENTSIYRPIYLPEDFIEVSSNIIGDIIGITYENKNGITIKFQQSPSQSSKLLIDHEDKNFTPIKVNEQEGYLVEGTDSEKSNFVIWEYNGVVFTITSEIESNELILMAESIPK